MRLSLLVTASLLLCSIAFGAESEWKTRLQEDGIFIATRKIEGAPILEFKSSVTVNAPLNTVLAFFEDETQIPKWYHQCILMEEVEAKSSTDKIFYFVIDLPWPVAKRDTVFRRVREDNTDAVTYTLSALPDRLPKEKGKVRVPYLKGIWRFTPKGDQTEVYFQQHSDAGGSLPAMLTNALVVDIPLNSLKKFRSLIEKS